MGNQKLVKSTLTCTKVCDRLQKTNKKSIFYEHTNCVRPKQHLCGQATTSNEHSHIYDDTQKSIFKFSDH